MWIGSVFGMQDVNLEEREEGGRGEGQGKSLREVCLHYKFHGGCKRWLLNKLLF